MLPPIRPRPIIPSCMACSPALSRVPARRPILARRDPPRRRRRDVARQRSAGAEPGELPGVALVGEERDPIVCENRLLGWQLSGSLVLLGQLTRLALARLDVRLVERIDADDRPGDGGGDLPAE